MSSAPCPACFDGQPLPESSARAGRRIARSAAPPPSCVMKSHTLTTVAPSEGRPSGVHLQVRDSSRLAATLEHASGCDLMVEL